MIKTVSTQNKYELKVDVKEKFEGMFTKEAIENMKNDYKTKILPFFKGRQKCRSYSSCIYGGKGDYLKTAGY
ncbi:hypothetical protein [Clostridium estertheticum]|uniref:hypothetical protein n=1 Tax=Clostridium estertheticum TaxID=238834 RepID=UPI001CF13C86|nr:hypothetical protein [Clostridium estertheticum]MCB2338905.1 hypothetical protein [Clostridium estertheticum]